MALQNKIAGPYTAEVVFPGSVLSEINFYEKLSI